MTATMKYPPDEILSRLQLGEAREWEFKEVHFAGDRLTGPKRNDIADEMAAYANSDGGTIVFGATGNGEVQGMTRGEMDTLGKVLVQACTQSIEPPLAVQWYRRLIGEKPVIVVVVPRGYAQHDSPGGSYQRVGSLNVKMSRDQQLRLAQERATSGFVAFDKSAVPDTGLRSLDEALWKRFISIHGADAPEVALEKMGLMTQDESEPPRATVAGLLLCARAPEAWLDNACITATSYKGTDRASMQLASETICGPLDRQIGDAVAFVLRNMRVAARKEPGRVDLPQFSKKAVFEAVVNAVVHRDYSIRGRRIRISVFEDRLEVQSPGLPANGLRIDAMEFQQATRNAVLASALGRMSTEKIRRAGNRKYVMDRRGDGVGTIRREMEATGTASPVYEVVSNTDLRLTIPAAPLGRAQSAGLAGVNNREEK